jgi:7-methyl-GTP pyrophosphatase
MDLILASTSPYRQQLLKRLKIPFRCEAPDVDETPLTDEQPEALALRLAIAKAESVADRYPGALVLGSDQVASIDGRCIGKPGNRDNARQQLAASSGREVTFFTGLALVAREAGSSNSLVEEFRVHFRVLSETEIETYLTKESPYDCAGSFKCEGLGVALFERMMGDDPTSLEGLPLIATCRLLRAVGQPVL